MSTRTTPTLLKFTPKPPKYPHVHEGDLRLFETLAKDKPDIYCSLIKVAWDLLENGIVKGR
jgi:hypothetical protein